MSVVRALQDDFPISDRPFAKIGSEIGIAESEVWSILTELARDGYVSRIVGRQKRTEIKQTQVLVVWQVPGEKSDAVAIFKPSINLIF